LSHTARFPSSAVQSDSAAESTPALLALEDGRVFYGESFGAIATVTGEVCFNTSMTGYQEILTDPSYRGQIVAMTYPEIGNVGVNAVDEESSNPHLRGFVIAELSPVVSNWRATSSLPDYLASHGIPGLRSIDTRALTKHLRERGALRGCLSSEGITAEEAIALARSSDGMEGMDFVREVTTHASCRWDELDTQSNKWVLPTTNPSVPAPSRKDGEGNHFSALPAAKGHVVVLDFGSKHNILRLLRQNGFEVTCLPATASAEEILSLKPQGVLLSNGPGDPAALEYAHQTVRDLIGKLPVFGICLGHQIIALALGGKTFKLKFGHRGANHPVQDLGNRAIAITSQNHGFAVEADSLPPDVEVTHLNLNDRTVAGLRHKTLPVCSVQYHPEASPGPKDTEDFFVSVAKIFEKSAASC
jgi:carbamoyl-phosphate synthase small subunit